MNVKGLPRTTQLGAMIALCLAGGAAVAQSTTGSISGQVPAGDTVVIQGANGLSRSVRANSQGRYTASQLPLGEYTVTLKRDGKVVDTREHVVLTVGAAAQVSFAAPQEAEDMSAVTVSANALPSIDVSSVTSETVISAEQLAKLPLGFSAEAAAQLAPGAVDNNAGYKSPVGGSLVSFGGAGANENAYYINGFNTTDPFKSLGGLTLPYGSISQEQVLTGGYSAKYGRSDGGVVNMVGKRGTNEWHFGGKASWEPAFARASQSTLYYEHSLPTAPGQVEDYGSLYDARGEGNYWRTTYDAYLGGPLIKDKLFLFASVEAAKTEGTSLGPVTSVAPWSRYETRMPKWYAKLDWNINDRNILELTGASNKMHSSGTTYEYDYKQRRRGDGYARSNDVKTGGTMWVAHYTGYVTDQLTVSALYGKMTNPYYDVPPDVDPDLVYIGNPKLQNPALNGGVPRHTDQTVTSITDPRQKVRTSNLRLSLEYQLGNHTLTAGIDNLDLAMMHHGGSPTGPGYSWTYQHTDNPENPLVSGLGVGATADFPNGAEGYYVTQHVGIRNVSVHSSQRGQFIEDKWQVSPRFLLSLGLRNGEFTNYNPLGQAFIKQRNELAPRLGFSWDVYGDASFKVYGNAGRYFLATPLEPSFSAASSGIDTTQYFTYGGINADGTPADLTAMAPPVSANNHFGQPRDPKTVAVKDIKPMYNDEFMVGFTKTLGDAWLYGAKATRRVLRSAIDDGCLGDLIVEKARELGYDDIELPGCYMVNAGARNTFVVKTASGEYHDIPLSRKEIGYPELKRNYYALELFMEHPFDGRWFGKIDYVFSRSYGNTEGMTQSNVQSSGPQESADWDNVPIMVWSNGDQGNDHRHQIKAFGYYQINPQWLVSGSLRLISGQPRACLGLFPQPDSDPAGYGSLYHYCDYKPAPPGSRGRLPWTRQLDVGVTYKPAFAAQKLAFNLNVFNLFNAQTETNTYPSLYADSAGSPNPLYGTARVTQAPRYVRFSVTYDY